ncbi:MAG: ABC transporter substrate-binding protein [Deltaproteobacteria bacterium]|jgi:putative ABC transport system substrate-binding protein|nr:ABC transporter substrate-binding protein [Deltaproteobacteria bacterium]
MKLLKILFLSAAFLFTLQAGKLPAYEIAIHLYVEHPALEQAVLGFQNYLQEAGLNATYKLRTAQARADAANQIVSQIIGDKPDLIFVLATPSAQATVNAVKDIPVLFTAVTDPVGAKLVSSWEKPGANVTGTSDMNPVADQIALIKEIQPDLKTLGIIYNSGEANSTVQVKLAEEKAAELGIELVKALTVNTAGVNAAAQSLVGKVQAIYLPTDNTVISSLESVIAVCLDQKIPLYPAEDDSIRKGGVAVISLNYYQLGKQTGRMAERILKDKTPPGSIPVEGQESPKLIVNKKFADALGLSVPESVLSRADEILE